MKPMTPVVALVLAAGSTAPCRVEAQQPPTKSTPQADYVSASSCQPKNWASGVSDGYANAPSGVVQHPELLCPYGGARPPFHVPGVDYYVGLPPNTELLDPTVASNLPPGTSVDAVHQTIRVTGNNVTLSGFDFSLHGSYSVYIVGASGTRIVNNYFGGGPVAVNGDIHSSNAYVGYNTIDGPGASNCSFGETIYLLGPGAVVEYNWIRNSPQHYLSVNSGGTVTYRYNLLEDGGWCKGAHLNFLQFGGGNFATPQVVFNTVIQHVTAASGEVFQMYTNNAGSISNGLIAYNTIITSPTILAPGGVPPAVSYAIHAGSNSQYPGSFTGSVQNNYFDMSSAYGPFYLGLKGFSYSGNIDMVHNTVYGPP